jgi:hypothetical protein
MTETTRAHMTTAHRPGRRTEWRTRTWTATEHPNGATTWRCAATHHGRTEADAEACATRHAARMGWTMEADPLAPTGEACRRCGGAAETGCEWWC